MLEDKDEYWITPPSAQVSTAVWLISFGLAVLTSLVPWLIVRVPRGIQRLRLRRELMKEKNR